MLELYIITLVEYFSSFLFFRLLLFYRGLNSTILLPFTAISPISGQVGSSDPCFPSNRIHLTTTTWFSRREDRVNVNVLVGACWVGLKGTGSHITCSMWWSGSRRRITHSGHMNWLLETDSFMHRVWKKFSHILHYTTGLLLVWTRPDTLIIDLLHRQWGHFSTLIVNGAYLIIGCVYSLALL